MKRFGFIFLLILVTGSLALAQNSEEIISLKVLSSVSKFKAGESHPVAIELNISEPYHINSNQPAEAYLIPTEIQFKEQPGVTFGRLTYPVAEQKIFSFSENPLSVYEETVYIFTSLTLSPDFKGKRLTVEGTFGYQACNDATCLAPDEISFAQEFPVAGPQEAVTPVNQEIFRKSRQAEAEADLIENEAPQGFGATVEQKGLFLAFVLVFLGGLALNLTPCVYPLIPITISYFGGQAEGKKGSLVTHAVLYVLGMAITYSILGVIAALTGSLFGAALQNPVVLIVIALILIALSLSMFDLYEIRVPAFLSNFAGGSRQGFFGTFFMGLTVGIVAAPCIGPFVLALLTYVGNRGDVFLGFWMFFVLALGLGLPFLFLGIFSGSIGKLPRSGAWMIWVRAIFGFVLIAMAIYFLQPLFPNQLLYFLAMAVTMLVGGIYMAWIEPTPSQGKIFPVIRNLVGVLFFIIALFLATTGIQSYIDNQFAEVRLAGDGPLAEQDIDWARYSDAALQAAAAENRPVLIDFYADWCIPCKELEKFTFSQPEVVDISREFTMLKVDLTKSSDPVNKALKNQYNIKGVPTLVFLMPDGRELDNLRVVGFVEKEDFLPRMEDALHAVQQD